MTFTFSPNWEKISGDDFGYLFSDSINKIDSQLIKLELLQSYSEPGDPSYDAFMNGNMEKAKEELQRRISNQQEIYTTFAQRKIHFSRIRYAEQPFSEYIKYELLSYPISASFGEQIVFVDQNGVDESINSSRYFRDCLIFDKRIVLINNYTEGRPDGGYVTVSNYDIEKFIDVANILFKTSKPLGSIIDL